MAGMLRLALGCLLAAPAAAAAAKPLPAHLQSIMDAYEASKLRCHDGHSGVIIMLHDKSPNPSELSEHLRSKGRKADRVGHVYAAPHTIRGISAKLTDETLREVLRDGDVHGIIGVHADCFRRHRLPAPQASSSHTIVRTLTKGGVSPPVADGTDGGVSEPSGDIANAKDESATVGSMDDTVGTMDTMHRHAGLQEQVSNWGLDLASKVGAAKDHNYEFGTATGQGTVLYHIDTGVQMSHVEFARRDADGNVTGSRVLKGWSMGCTDPADGAQTDACAGLWVYGANITDEVLNRKNEIPADDGIGSNKFTEPGRGCDAHGTHTASIVLGGVFGVAKKAELVTIQGLSCVATAQDSLVVKALEQVVEDARAQVPYKPAVVLLSLGGEKDGPLNEAVKRTTLHHIGVVVAAGNDHSDACTTTPSAVSRAATVAAITEDNKLASFSSYGRCVDFLAPGDSIKAAYASVGTNQGVMTLSGTSMAAPFVAGAMLQALGLFPQMTTAQTKQLLRCVGSKGAVTGDEIASATPNVRVRIGKALASIDSVRKGIREAHRVSQKAETARVSSADDLDGFSHPLFWESGKEDEYVERCVKLVDELERTRPADGVLPKSPDALNDTVIVDYGENEPPSPPPGTIDDRPYRLAKAARGSPLQPSQ